MYILLLVYSCITLCQALFVTLKQAVKFRKPPQKTKLSAVCFAFKITRRPGTEECTVECRHITFTLQSLVLTLKFARTYVFRTVPTKDDNDFCLQHLPIGLSIESTSCPLRYEMNPYLQL